MESDYAATLGCGYRKDPDVDKLQLHGKYKDEYNSLTLLDKSQMFERVLKRISESVKIHK